MNVKLVVIFALILSCYLVSSHTSIPSVSNYEVVAESSNKTERSWLGFLLWVEAYALAIMAIVNAGRCSSKGGCNSGYCWAYCGISLKGGDWCYTTETYSQSYQYVTCKDDSDCNLCWKCGGPCSL